MQESLQKLWHDDSAQDVSEYALLLLFVTVALVLAVGMLKDTIIAGFDRISGIFGG